MLRHDRGVSPISKKIKNMSFIFIILVFIAFLVFYLFLRQRQMNKACKLMLEALENHDYTFRLSSKGILWGDRKIAETLNGLISQISLERQDIEVQSWEKLTRILTHEIMNGIAPIMSLSEVFMKDKRIVDSPLYDGMKAIRDTSVGLMDFVDSYRKFTSLQEAHPEHVSICDIIEGVQSLGVAPNGIKLTTVFDLENEYISVDKNLFRQVIINIVKNATESFEHDAEGNIVSANAMIQIFAYQYPNTPLRIRISNNGKPIPDDVRQDIFIPFFSTKKTGSGVGLALCRQIMRMSGGTINILPAGANGWSTSFIIELPV